MSCATARAQRRFILSDPGAGRDRRAPEIPESHRARDIQDRLSVRQRLDAVKGARQLQADARLPEITEHIRRDMPRPLFAKKVEGGAAQEGRYFLQPAATHAVGALFIFLHLLEREINRSGELFLGYALFIPVASNILADPPVGLCNPASHTTFSLSG